MCYMQWVIARSQTRSDDFFQHGFFQKRTSDCTISQRQRAHCSDADTYKPKYREILASAQRGDQKYFVWDPELHWTRDMNGERVVDERRKNCRVSKLPLWTRLSPTVASETVPAERLYNRQQLGRARLESFRLQDSFNSSFRLGNSPLVCFPDGFTIH
jgi:hypothetical protein